MLVAATCSVPTPGQVEQQQVGQSSLWYCTGASGGTTTFTTGDRVHISECSDTTQLEDTMHTCEYSIEHENDS